MLRKRSMDRFSPLLSASRGFRITRNRSIWRWLTYSLAASLCFLLLCFAVFFSSSNSVATIELPASVSTASISSSSSSHAWMDEREYALVLRTMEAFNKTSYSVPMEDGALRMLEFGSGLSSFSLSMHAAVYLSIEHATEWCDEVLPRMIKQAEIDAHRRQKIILSRFDAQLNVLNVQRESQVMLPSPVDDLPQEVMQRLNELAQPKRSLQFICVSQNQPRDEETWRLKLYCKYWHRCPSSTAQFRDYLSVPQFIRSLNNARFDVILIDGRARPQAAYACIKLLQSRSESRIIVHDWNQRPPYHILLRWFEIVDQQLESSQSGGGGLVVLRVRDHVSGDGSVADLAGIRNESIPEWW